MKLTYFLTPTLFLTGVLHAADFNRPLAADRPDSTESPITVEAGRFQFDTELWSYTRDRSKGVKTRMTSLLETNMKYGLSYDQDLELVLRPWIDSHTKGRGKTISGDGFGDLDLRLKWNLWGNDRGRTAGGLIPYLTIPSKTVVSDDVFQGGIIFPVELEINAQWEMGAQLELMRAVGDRRREWQLGHTAVIGYEDHSGLGIFLEYIGISAESGYQASIATGVTLATSENLRWDASVIVGLNHAADDFAIGHGVTFRF